MPPVRQGFPLRPTGPVEWLDRAFSTVRAGGLGVALSAAAGALPLFWLVVLVYYLERVEGVRSLRPVFALGLGTALVYRSLRISNTSRAFVQRLRPELLVDRPPSPRPARIASASLHGLGLSGWAAVGLLASQASPYLLVGLVPMFALRGVIAPAWLARVSCDRRQGWSALGHALDDNRGSRAEMYAVELLVLVGIAGLYGNLFGVLSFLLALAHSMFGLEVAVLAAFASPDNPLMILLLLGVACLAFEPLRAAISAISYADARTRRDGADLVAALDDAIRPGPTTAGLLVLCVVGLACASAPPSAVAEAPKAPDALPAAATSDIEVRAEVRRILAEPEFREFASGRETQLSTWFSDLFERLDSWVEASAERADDKSLEAGLPAPPVWLLVGLPALLAVAALWLLRGGRNAPLASDPIPAAGAARPDGAPDDADSLASRGEHRMALRALYLSTLALLDRAHLIELDVAATNWQYLRQLPPGETRVVFTELTRLFDHKWYGKQPTQAEDYAQGRACVDRLGALLLRDAGDAQ